MNKDVPHSIFCDTLRDHQMVDPHCPRCGDPSLPCRFKDCPVHPKGGNE